MIVNFSDGMERDGWLQEFHKCLLFQLEHTLSFSNEEVAQAVDAANRWLADFRSKTARASAEFANAEATRQELQDIAQVLPAAAGLLPDRVKRLVAERNRLWSIVNALEAAAKELRK